MSKDSLITGLIIGANIIIDITIMIVLLYGLYYVFSASKKEKNKKI